MRGSPPVARNVQLARSVTDPSIADGVPAEIARVVAIPPAIVAMPRDAARDGGAADPRTVDVGRRPVPSASDGPRGYNCRVTLMSASEARWPIPCAGHWPICSAIAGCWCGDRDLTQEPAGRRRPARGRDRPRASPGVHRRGSGWTFSTARLLERRPSSEEDAIQTVSMRIDALSASAALRHAERHLPTVPLAPANFNELPEAVQTGLLGRIVGGLSATTLPPRRLPYYL